MIVAWNQIDSVLLDMDGTLLDKYFDDYFWEERVPEQFSAERGIPLDQAKSQLLAAYQSVARTLAWTDLDYWSDRLGLNIVAMKEEVAFRVSVHPGVEAFLQFLRNEKKQIALVTNAHPKTIEIKLRKTSLAPALDAILSSTDVGVPKEDMRFWEEAERRLHFDKRRSLLIDDNEEVLRTAHAFGIQHILFKSESSSRLSNGQSKQFPSMNDFRDIFP